MSCSLALQYALDAADLPTRAQVRRWVLATRAVQAAQGQPLPDAVLTLRFVDAREGRRLNRDHRGRDYATNVLTFNLHEGAPASLAMPIVADLVICWPVVRREAREQHKTVLHHAAHMIVHGVLHAHGHDHDRDRDAQVMEALEQRVLARFRIADPYALA